MSNRPMRQALIERICSGRSSANVVMWFGSSRELYLHSEMKAELRPGQRPFEDDVVDAIFAESHGTI